MEKLELEKALKPHVDETYMYNPGLLTALSFEAQLRRVPKRIRKNSRMYETWMKAIRHELHEVYCWK